MFNDMLPIALQCGINILDYWFLTYGEIVDTVKAFREVDRLRIREVATFNYSLATLISKGIARVLDGKSDYPSLKGAYPGIFTDIDETPVQQNAEIMKERFMKYAEANNKKVR